MKDEAGGQGRGWAVEGLKAILSGRSFSLKTMKGFQKMRDMFRFVFQKMLFAFVWSSAIFFFKYLFIYLFMAVLGLRFCARAFSTCGKRGPLYIAVRGPLTIAASLVAEHRLQTHRLSNCGSRA